VRPRNRRGGRRKRKPTSESSYRQLERTRIPRAYLGSVPVPAFSRKRMLFYEPNLAIVPGGVAFYVKDWRANDVYDPDPSIGGGSISGFTQFVALWNIWRVDRFRFRYEIVNMETAVPLQFFFTMKDWQPSIVLNTYAKCQDAAEVSGSSSPHILGVLNGNNVYRSGNGSNPDREWGPWVRPSAILGDQLLYRASAGYSGQGSASPSSVIWLSVVVLADGPGGTMPAGFVLNLEIEFDTMWYSTVSTLPSLEKISQDKTDLLLAKDFRKRCAIEDSGLPRVEARETRSFHRLAVSHKREGSAPPSIRR